MNLGVEALGRAVCWGRIAHNSKFARKILPLLQNCFKHQLNIRSSLQCFRFWKFYFFPILQWYIFCRDRTKISFVGRQFFKASASFIGSYIFLLFINQSQFSILWEICILFPSFCITFPRICTVFTKTALLSANQIQRIFSDVYYKWKIKPCRIFAPTSFKDAEFLHF